MSLVVRKPVFGVSDQTPDKPGCRPTEDGYRLEISDEGSTGIVLLGYVAVYGQGAPCRGFL